MKKYSLRDEYIRTDVLMNQLGHKTQEMRKGKKNLLYLKITVSGSFRYAE